MAKIVIVAGLSGAGKTTLLSSIAKRHKDFQVIQLWTIMKKEADARRIKVEHDTIKKLDNATLSKLRLAAFKRLALMKGGIILDTHLSIEGQNMFTPGIPTKIIKIKALDICGMVYVNASSDEIIKRRSKDKNIRSREEQAHSSLDMQRIIDISILANYANMLDMPLHIIHNREGGQELAAKELESALAGILKG
jgi:adenylate kinase